MRLVRFTLFAALLLLPMLTACQTGGGTTGEVAPLEPLPADGKEAPIPPESGLAMATEQRFSDIPLPANAKQIPERTYVYETSELQVGRMVYTSKAAMGELANFYIKECPAGGWTRESLTETAGLHLGFTKPGKRLDIDISEQGVGRPRLLVINLQPVPTGAGGS